MGHSNLCTKRKLESYKACIETKLLYGLHTACLSTGERRRLDGFQAKCLRKVVGIAHSYYSRVSNKDVLNIAGHQKAPSILADQQVSLFGRSLRASPQSQWHASAFIRGTVQPATSRYVRRVGRPRREWATAVIQEARSRAPPQDIFQLAQNGKQWHQAMHSRYRVSSSLQ